MKLHLNAVPVIVTVLFLLSMVGLRESAFRVTYTAPVLNMPADSVAFPGAEGWGAPTLTGCNRDSVYVHKVTNLNDSGTGSFRNAVTNLHPDTLDIIIFTTGGWISAASGLGSLWDSTGGEDAPDCVYVAGQTSPGEGIGLRGPHRVFNLHDGKDLVLRGITDAGDSFTVSTTPHVTLKNHKRAIISEWEAWFWREEALQFGADGVNDTTRDVTIQRSLFAHPQDQNTSNQISQAKSGGTVHQFSLYYNLYHSGGWRAPNISTEDAPPYGNYNSFAGDVAANVCYNQLRNCLQFSGWALDFLDHYYKPGPSRDSRYDYGIVFRVGADISSGRQDSISSAYVDRIIGARNKDTLAIADSLWADGGGHQEVACYYRDCNDPAGGGDPRTDGPATNDPVNGKRDTLTTGPTFRTARINPYTVYTQLAGTASDSGQVGNYRRIQCDGTWAMRSDSVHSALLKHVRDSTGLSAKITKSEIQDRMVRSGYNTRASGVACDDTDGDGMPNAYEDRMSDLDKNDATDKTSDSDLDGWTAIEEYVNGTSSDSYTASDGTEGSGGFETTYGNNRNVYLLTFTLDTTAEGRIVRRPDADSLAQLTKGFRLYARPSKLQGLVVTCDTIPLWAVMDSAVVEDSLSAWAITTQPIMRAVNVPGCL